MTNDLISREALLKKAIKVSEFDEGGWEVVLRAVPVEDIEAAEAVDAAPVVHGHYGFTGPHIGETYSPYAEHGSCSNCKSRILIDPQHKNFCPNCGAKMDKEE